MDSTEQECLTPVQDSPDDINSVSESSSVSSTSSDDNSQETSNSNATATIQPDPDTPTVSDNQEVEGSVVDENIDSSSTAEENIINEDSPISNAIIPVATEAIIDTNSVGSEASAEVTQDHSNSINDSAGDEPHAYVVGNVVLAPDFQVQDYNSEQVSGENDQHSSLDTSTIVIPAESILTVDDQDDVCQLDHAAITHNAEPFSIEDIDNRIPITIAERIYDCTDYDDPDSEDHYMTEPLSTSEDTQCDDDEASITHIPRLRLSNRCNQFGFIGIALLSLVSIVSFIVAIPFQNSSSQDPPIVPTLTNISMSSSGDPGLRGSIDPLSSADTFVEPDEVNDHSPLHPAEYDEPIESHSDGNFTTDIIVENQTKTEGETEVETETDNETNIETEIIQVPVERPLPPECDSNACLYVKDTILNNTITTIDQLYNVSSKRHASWIMVANEENEDVRSDVIHIVERYVQVLLELSIVGDVFEDKISSGTSYLLQKGHTNRYNKFSWWKESEFEGATLPPEISALKELSMIDVKAGLGGTIPSELSQLSNLIMIDLSHNKFSGTFPAVILEEVPELLYLNLERSGVGGTIPSEIGYQTSLLSLDFQFNKFQGEIPSEIGKLSLLTTLSLKNNRLTGTVPSEIQQLDQLVQLRLEYNYLEGDLTPFCSTHDDSQLDLKTFTTDCASTKLKCYCCTQCF